MFLHAGSAVRAGSSIDSGGTGNRVIIVSSAAAPGRVSIGGGGGGGGGKGSPTGVRSAGVPPLRPLPSLIRRIRIIGKHSEYADKLDALLDEFASFKVTSMTIWSHLLVSVFLCYTVIVTLL